MTVASTISTQFPSADREGTFLSFLDRSLGKVETLFLVTILSVYGRNETFLVAFYLDRTDFRCFRNRSLLRETFDREISCHAFYARYLETDRQVAGGLQGMLNRRQYLHARLLTIDQGGSVDPRWGRRCSATSKFVVMLVIKTGMTSRSLRRTKSKP